mgnify:CR=1 FL=1
MNRIVRVMFLGLIVGTMISCASQKDQSDNLRGEGNPPNFMMLLEEMDLNDDGKLSKEEVQGPLLEDFSKIDENEDGFITEDEFEKMSKTQRPERPQRQKRQGNPRHN